jgi:hypothetical protein
VRQKLPVSDWTACAVAFFATILSIVAYVITARHGGVVLYKDAMSHLEIARRVDVTFGSSPVNALPQLGSVWLPLPHLLMLPFVWSNALYTSGLGGAINCIVAYVIATVLIYKITYRLADNKVAGVVAAAVFGFNINELYMQATPMTEALLFCNILATVYCIQRWAETDRYKYLVGAGVAGFLAALSRYESWLILFALLGVVAVIAWQQRPDFSLLLRRNRTIDRTLLYGLFALVGGIGSWMLWGAVYFGNPFDFEFGTYAKQALVATHTELSYHNWSVSIKTYWYAMLDNVSWPVVVTASLGLIAFLVFGLRSKQARLRALPVLSLVVIVPLFFFVCLYVGQRPLHVMQIWGGTSDYNVRYGLFMEMPAAILIGYLVSCLRFKWATYVTAVLAVAGSIVLCVVLLVHGKIATYNEALAGRESVAIADQRSVEGYLAQHYKGGRAMMESYGNEDIAFDSVPTAKMVYEGSYGQWQPALHNPVANQIEWIITRRGTTPDMVARTVPSSQLAHYVLVFQSPDNVYSVYLRR